MSGTPQKPRFEWGLISLIALAFACLSCQPLYAQSSLLEAADKLITKKKYKAAVGSITKAMNSGKLSDAEMARALYRRGVANNHLAHSASAIADLTGALFVGKLNTTDRRNAYLQRSRAYEAAGLKRQARADIGRSGSSSKTPASTRRQINKTPSLPLPVFKTTVKAAKSAPPKPQKKVARAAKKTKPKKTSIPAFRTSIQQK